MPGKVKNNKTVKRKDWWKVKVRRCNSLLEAFTVSSELSCWTVSCTHPELNIIIVERKESQHFHLHSTENQVGQNSHKIGYRKRTTDMEGWLYFLKQSFFINVSLQRERERETRSVNKTYGGVNANERSFVLWNSRYCRTYDRLCGLFYWLTQADAPQLIIQKYFTQDNRKKQVTSIIYTVSSSGIHYKAKFSQPMEKESTQLKGL